MRYTFFHFGKMVPALGLLLTLAGTFPIDVYCQTLQTPNNPSETIDPQLEAITDQLAAAGLLRPSTVSEVRQAYPFYAKLGGPAEPLFHIEDRRIPGRVGGISIRLYVPRAGTGFPIWVFFHGGGFVAGSLDTHETPLRAVANRCDCLIVSVAYRLAPENPYPAARDDAYAATKWVADHASEIGGDPKRIAVGGDGAGGNLAAVVALMSRDRGSPQLVYQVLIYPILDIRTSTVSWITSTDPVLTSDSMIVKWSVYVPVTTDPQDPYISPEHANNLAGLPPTLILIGKNDPLKDTANLFATKLRDAGVPVQLSWENNVVHSFFLMGGALSEGKKSIEQIADALGQQFAAAK